MMWCSELNRDVRFCSGACKICTKRKELQAINLLDATVEELENCYGRETELTHEIRTFLALQN